MRAKHRAAESDYYKRQVMVFFARAHGSQDDRQHDNREAIHLTSFLHLLSIPLLPDNRYHSNAVKGMNSI